MSWEIFFSLQKAETLKLQTKCRKLNHMLLELKLPSPWISQGPGGLPVACGQ